MGALMQTKRLFQRTVHFFGRVRRELKVYKKNKNTFGKKIAKCIFRDGLIPPGKSPKYIATIQQYVDEFLMDVVEKHAALPDESVFNNQGKIKIWCCWWQGVEQMPELVKMCHQRLKSIIPQNAELHIITRDNYLDYIELPQYIIDKFNNNIITMTTMSDVLRFRLLEKYGGYWLDATVFFTDKIPAEYFSGGFYCQRMANSNILQVQREACKGNWCGFSMAGPAHSPVFRFMNDAFDKWWAHYDTIIEYVLIDYMLMTGFKYVPNMKTIIDAVPDNNVDIFEFYKKLNEPYSEELYAELTKNNVMHKLTYKMDLQKQTKDGKDTLYGHLLKEIYGEKEGNAVV